MAFDFDAAVTAPFRMQPGLRRLAPGTPQLTPTVVPHRGVARHLREKLAVLWAFRDQALCSVPGFDAGAALVALASHAAAEQPQALRLDGCHWQAPGLGWSLDARDTPHQTGTDWPEVGTLLREMPAAWRRAALVSLAFAEDFAVVDAASGTIPWLAVALPSMWAPEDKVGQSFASLHAPVADAQMVRQAAPQLLRLVTSGEPWERFVWTLTAHPRLHAHPRRVAPERWAPGLRGDALACQTWFRTERQTFIPVPGSGGAGAAGQAVFTIHVDTRRMDLALAEPARAAKVHDALASMSDAVLAYRGLTAMQRPLLDWLAARAGA